jgi:hypothetical protein
MSKVVKVAVTAADKHGISLLEGAAFMADISEKIPQNQAVPSNLKFINLRFAVPVEKVEDFQAALETGTIELVIEGVAPGVDRAFGRSA